MNKTTFGCLIAGLIVALGLSVSFNLIQFVTLIGFESELTEKVEPFNVQLVRKGQDDVPTKIVHLDLEGIIRSMSANGFLEQALTIVEVIKRALDQAVTDEQVKAIVLRVNSPGGEATASDII